jgi:asparagine synthase (glutamine-hydrolysing)
MCRIAGIIGDLGDKNLSVQRVQSMLDAMRKGGPDDEGLVHDDHVVFGHRRLSIIDTTEAAHQPMQDEDCKNWIVFNGEIYNYLDLKHELITLGCKFRSKSDTEVILKAYQMWGTNSFARLNGIFAFALYDVSAKKVLLVRDPQGVKPLYYKATETTFTFSSELRSDFWKKQEVDEQWKVRFLAFGFMPEPYTIYKNVLALPKSHFMQFDLQHNTSTLLHYKYQSTCSYPNLREAVMDSVQRQLVSDVPLGSFLSGGLDSSIITICAAKEQTAINTVSLTFQENKFSEQVYQSMLVDSVHVEPHYFNVRQQDFDSNIEKVLDAYYLPSNDGINAWFISKYASESGLKVALSGLGADELFGGYPSFRRIAALKFLKAIKGFSRLTKILPAKYSRMQYLNLKPGVSDYLFLRGIFSITQIASLLTISSEKVIEVLNDSIFFGMRSVENYQDLSLLEQNIYMNSQLLRDIDCMSMQHGLEVRVPFLDNELYAFVNDLADSDRFQDVGTKRILADSFVNELPTAIFNRKKQGFVLPFQHWMKDSTYILERWQGRPIHTAFVQGKIHWSKFWVASQVV